MDIFRYNTAAKKYRKEQKRKAQVGPHEESSDNDDDDGLSTSSVQKKYAKEKRRKGTVKQHQESSDESNSDEDVLPPTSESSMEETIQEDCHAMVQPREIYRGGISDLMNDQGLFSCFVEHYLGWEGGMRKQRVARLLFQIDPHLQDPSRLWRAKDVRVIWKCFFEGNSSRKAGTLKSHIHSYRMFLQFVDNPGVDISHYVALEEDDQKAIREMREKLKGWLKCLDKLTHKRKAEVQQQDQGEVLGQEEYNELMALSTAKDMIKEFSNLQADYLTNSTDFVRIRDLIIVRLLVSAQWLGAVVNLMIEEFENGKWDEENDLYITGTVQHKTPSLGPASLCWDRTTYELGQVYLGR